MTAAHGGDRPAAGGAGPPSRWADHFHEVHARPLPVKWGVEYLAGGACAGRCPRWSGARTS
ncbi:hypothetical protein J2S46_001653 [Kitasatospora herbaricolor]|uniref:hypothetical protein n=1 Tax=Kitasatospora herbaricolor TaxID=68217 RepID=UPI001749C77C|nr:hypothetical protein [Kitasatospora herbaricolor]MDQ0307097.1 hypothetical protein [Kitasatospora herbaricolor]